MLVLGFCWGAGGLQSADDGAVMWRLVTGLDKQIVKSVCVCVGGGGDLQSADASEVMWRLVTGLDKQVGGGGGGSAGQLPRGERGTAVSRGRTRHTLLSQCWVCGTGAAGFHTHHTTCTDTHILL